MTSFSGESFHGDYLPVITAGRCHTALGIYNRKPPNKSPPLNKKTPEKSISLQLSNSNSPCLSPVRTDNPPTMNYVARQPNNINMRSDIFIPKYDENRNLNCSRTTDTTLSVNNKHVTVKKMNFPGFLRKLRTSKRYKK